MRPTRLEIEGFASFRDRTVVDLEDAPLFVFFGPTGAGKSSLIDAIVFALYGAVPRYADKRLVAPVISQGLNEARVRLDFRANGSAYTAVRVVQRTSTGATTKEARLESGDRMLAGTADELTDQATRLLGLSFEHFTRCVVLPQGAFADFMHAKPSDRQDLLVQLLGLDLYERVRASASQLATELQARAGMLEQRLDRELADATEEAVAAAEERANAIEALLARIDAARPELEALCAKEESAREAARVADLRVKLLDAVRIPEGLDDLLRRVAAAGEAANSAQTAHEEALESQRAAEQERAELPERAALDGAAKVHSSLRDAGTRMKVAEETADSAAGSAKHAQEVATAAEAAFRAADEALEAMKRERAAAHLADHLVAGEPCPVCQQTVSTLPSHAPPPELAEARERRAQVESALERARTAADRAARESAAREADVAGARRERDRLAREAATLRSPAEIDALRARIDAVEAKLAGAQRAGDDAAKRLRQAREDAQRLEAAAKRAWTELDAARDRLSAGGLAPPPAARDDLSVDWHVLVQWAGERLPEQREVAAAERAAAEEAATSREWKLDALREACVETGVTIRDDDPRTSCADDLAGARETARRLRRDMETAAGLRAELADVTKQTNTAKDLTRHLGARHFERWLMNRALRRLVAGATIVLRELSGGAYSLDLDGKNDFVVIDHRNADERRMARTLSGGETFLASLALALALAEHVAEASAGSGARLEALFLDEGFGTLDAETLETVATAIEELGSRGRIVGLVTHVRDLAERVPVRFEVRKVGGASHIERV